MPVTTPTLTAALHASGRAVTLTVSGYGSATTYRMRRLVAGVDGDGPTWFLRGGIDQAVATATVIDTDFPQGVPVTYKVKVSDGTPANDKTSAETAAFTIDLGSDYLGSMTAAMDGVPVTFTALDGVAREARADIVKVLARADPVVVADTRVLPKFDLGVYCRNLTIRDAVIDLLEDSTPVLLSPRSPGWWGGKSPLAWYAAVSDYTETFHGPSGLRVLELSCQQVGTPKVPLVTSLGNWDELPAYWDEP